MGFMKEAQQQRSIAVAHFYQHCSAASGIALLFAILCNTLHLALCNTLQHRAAAAGVGGRSGKRIASRPR